MERGRGGESSCESDEKLLRQKNKQKVFNIKTEVVFSLTFIALIFRTVFDSKQMRQTEEGVFIVKTPDVYISRHMDKIGNPSYLHLLFFFTCSRRFIQSDLQVHLSEETETTIYHCWYIKNVHRIKCRALTIVRLTHFLYTTKIAR